MYLIFLTSWFLWVKVWKLKSIFLFLYISLCWVLESLNLYNASSYSFLARIFWRNMCSLSIFVFYIYSALYLVWLIFLIILCCSNSSMVILFFNFVPSSSIFIRSSVDFKRALASTSRDCERSKKSEIKKINVKTYICFY